MIRKDLNNISLIDFSHKVEKNKENIFSETDEDIKIKREIL